MKISSISVCFTALLIAGCAAPANERMNNVASSVAQHVQITKAGSLESTHTLGCISMEDIKPIYTPADLYPAMGRCILENKFDKVPDIMAVAGIYARYDAFRVTDKSAHQARQALILKHVTSLVAKDERRKQKMKVVLSDMDNNKQAICGKVKKLGKPTYQPIYMAAHGMASYRTDPQRLIATNFDSDAAWQKSLSYLLCK